VGIGRWVVDTADNVSRVSQGVSDAEGLARRASSGTRDAGRGLTGIYRIGVAARARRGMRHNDDTVVAGELLYHPDAERARAVAMIDLAIGQFRGDAEPRATRIDAPPATTQWWSAEVAPVLSDSAVFRDHESSWIARAATEWSTYEAWLTVLRQLRSSARAQGLVLASPEPPRLPQTMLERGAAGRGGKLEAAWTIGRVLVYTAIGVAGIAGIYTVWRDLRSPKEDTGHELDSHEHDREREGARDPAQDRVAP
jgi:hypothetical protein